MNPKAVNFAAAIARFADSAATSALVPPSVLMLGFVPSDGAGATACAALLSSAYGIPPGYGGRALVRPSGRTGLTPGRQRADAGGRRERRTAGRAGPARRQPAVAARPR
ncbi:hypothetical protein GCM10018781_73230 [Kitasatospora indigofera]|uniref:Uncharacterized protein n=1 Tax=Kitasatospora indigofera TaxID=67307 RepID=A0A919L460_9ACTN|nr:hypothetical protein GCM10018781_73230 [Kitasatospora indigofera]